MIAAIFLKAIGLAFEGERVTNSGAMHGICPHPVLYLPIVHIRSDSHNLRFLRLGLGLSLIVYRMSVPVTQLGFCVETLRIEGIAFVLIEECRSNE
jgi:hypothetical protein